MAGAIITLALTVISVLFIRWCLRHNNTYNVAGKKRTYKRRYSGKHNPRVKEDENIKPKTNKKNDRGVR